MPTSRGDTWRFDIGWSRGEDYELVNRRVDQGEDVPAQVEEVSAPRSNRCCRWLNRPIFSKIRRACDWACADSVLATGWVGSCIAAGGLILCYLSTSFGFDWDEQFGAHTLVHVVGPIAGVVSLIGLAVARLFGSGRCQTVSIIVFGGVCSYILTEIRNSVIVNFRDSIVAWHAAKSGAPKCTCP